MLVAVLVNSWETSEHNLRLLKLPITFATAKQQYTLGFIQNRLHLSPAAFSLIYACSETATFVPFERYRL